MQPHQRPDPTGSTQQWSGRLCCSKNFGRQPPGRQTPRGPGLCGGDTTLPHLPPACEDPGLQSRGDIGWRRCPVSPPLLLSPSRAQHSKRQMVSPAACPALTAGPTLQPCLRPPRPSCCPVHPALSEDAAKQARFASGSLLGVTQHTGRREEARDGPAAPEAGQRPGYRSSTRLTPQQHRNPLPGPAWQPGLLAARWESPAETSPRRCPGTGTPVVFFFCNQTQRSNWFGR